MKKISKYYLILLFNLYFFMLQAQENTGAEAIVTITGDPAQTNVQLNNTNDFISTDHNPYADNNTGTPPSQQQMSDSNQNISPSLENGFHVRFTVEEPKAAERPSSSGYMSSSGGSAAKVKKHTVSIDERSFNFKKKMKTWLPKRKKRYHPHLCGRF